MHVPSPAGLMPTSSPGPCSNVQVGHSPAGSFMQTGAITRRFITISPDILLRQVNSEPLAVNFCSRTIKIPKSNLQLSRVRIS